MKPAAVATCVESGRAAAVGVGWAARDVLRPGVFCAHTFVGGVLANIEDGVDSAKLFTFYSANEFREWPRHP